MNKTSCPVRIGDICGDFIVEKIYPETSRVVVKCNQCGQVKVRNYETATTARCRTCVMPVDYSAGDFVVVSEDVTVDHRKLRTQACRCTKCDAIKQVAIANLKRKDARCDCACTARQDSLFAPSADESQAQSTLFIDVLPKLLEGTVQVRVRDWFFRKDKDGLWHSTDGHTWATISAVPVSLLCVPCTLVPSEIVTWHVFTDWELENPVFHSFLDADEARACRLDLVRHGAKCSAIDIINQKPSASFQSHLPHEAG